MHVAPIKPLDHIVAALQTERDGHLAAAARLELLIADLRRGAGAWPSAPTYLAPRQTHRVKRRFTSLSEGDPTSVTGLPRHHPAILEERTLFPSTVIAPADSPRVLVSGEHNRKLGDRIVKGPWIGCAIYHLTLEERATCPTSCAVYAQCYGNGMQQARRHSTVGLTERIAAELPVLLAQHPRGVAVRLHTLGDFYSVEYAAFWGEVLAAHPRLRIFGYTARDRGTAIGAAVAKVNAAFPDRCFIRFSSAAPEPGAAVTIFRKPEGPVVAEGIVCPAETGRTDCCGTCGLCWAPGARDKSIVFIAHGSRFGAGPRQVAPSGPRRYGRSKTIVVETIRAMTLGRERVVYNTVAARSGLSIMTVAVQMKALRSEGVLASEGAGRGSKWRLIGGTDTYQLGADGALARSAAV